MDDEETVRDIPFDESGIPKVDFFDSPLGPGREDKGTRITDANGKAKRTSNIMFGYNKDGIILEDGTYISWIEIAAAIIEDTTSELKENEHLVVRKTGKKISPEQMVNEIKEVVLETHSHIEYSEHEPLKNQPAATIEVYEAGENIPEKKGLLMLGSDGVVLPNGEYLPLEAIQEALSNYAITGKKTKPEREKQQEEETYKVLYRMKRAKIAPAVLATLCATSLIVAMIGKGSKEKVKVTAADILDYGISTIQVVDYTPESFQDLKYTVAREFTTGDIIFVPDGIEYHESSDYEYGGKNNTGTTHEGGIRESGYYGVNYISVLYDGFIQTVVYEPGIELDYVLEQEAKRLNCSKDDLIPMVHIGNEVCGWVNYDELISRYMEEGYTPSVYLEESVDIDGEVEYSETITIDNGTGKEVEITIVDENGDLLKPGTEVVGSDGCTYTINELNRVTKTEETVEEKEVVTFSIKNISPIEAIQITALGAAAILAARKKKEYLEGRMTEEEIKELVDDARKTFESSSDSQKLMKTIQTTYGVTPVTYDERMVEGIKDGKVPIKDFLEASGESDVPKTASEFEGIRKSGHTN